MDRLSFATSFSLFFFFEREEVFRVPKRGNSGQGGKVSETLAMDEGKDNVKSC